MGRKRERWIVEEGEKDKERQGREGEREDELKSNLNLNV